MGGKPVSRSCRRRRASGRFPGENGSFPQAALLPSAGPCHEVHGTRIAFRRSAKNGKADPFRTGLAFLEESRRTRFRRPGGEHIGIVPESISRITASHQCLGRLRGLARKLRPAALGQRQTAAAGTECGCTRLLLTHPFRRSRSVRRGRRDGVRIPSASACADGWNAA